MQMQIGTFRFEVAPGAPEYREMLRRSRRRWASRERYGRAPELEDLGPDAARIELRGTVWVRGAGDIEALDRLRGTAGMDPLRPEAGEPEPLAVFLGGGGGSSGQYLGRWAVTDLEETERRLRANGIPIAIDFRVQLLEGAA